MGTMSGRRMLGRCIRSLLDYLLLFSKLISVVDAAFCFLFRTITVFATLLLLALQYASGHTQVALAMTACRTTHFAGIRIRLFNNSLISSLHELSIFQNGLPIGLRRSKSVHIELKLIHSERRATRSWAKSYKHSYSFLLKSFRIFLTHLSYRITLT